MSGEKIRVENPNTPGRVENVDAAKYTAMKAAMLRVMSDQGMTAKAIKEAAIPLLPEQTFPGGATAGWWQKCVQLDLEAKGVVMRHKTKPLTFTKV